MPNRLDPGAIPWGLWAAVAGALGVAGLGLCDQLMEVDPAQYALVAWNAVSSGDWWHLADSNGPFLNKPPLMIHAQALAMAALGPTSAAARLPALAFAALAAVGTAWVGAQLPGGGPRLGARAALLLSASVAVQHMVADPKVDLALVAMVSLAAGAFLAGRARPGFTVAAWAFTAGAVLAKGPVGAALVAAAVGVELLRRGPGRAWAHAAGAALALALAAPFYLAVAAREGREALWYLLWRQGPGRLTGGAEFRDATTPLYVLHTGLWAFLPGTPALVAALAARWRSRQASPSLPLWWLGLTLLLVAVSPYKLPQYVYWAAPPAALLAAEALDALPRWVAPALAALGLAGGALLVGVLFPAPPGALVALGAALVGAAAVAQTAREPALRLACALGGLLACYQGWAHRALLAYQPAEPVAEAVRASGAPPGAPLQLVDVAPGFALPFYARRPLPQLEPAEAQPGLALASDDGLASLKSSGARLEVLGRWPSYPVSLPRRPFLQPATRASAVRWVTLVKLER